MTSNVLTRVFLAVAFFSGSQVAFSQEAKSDGGTRTQTTVQIDRLSRRAATPAFAFKNVPAPSKTDAGNLATPILVRGSADPNGGRVFVVQDGKLPENEDQPEANYFLAGVDPGRLLFDFGNPIEIKQINTYSWHPSTRADQCYDVFVPSAEIDETDASKSAAEKTLSSTWKKIASVDTRKEESSNAQIGVSIAGPSGEAIATTQFVLLAIEPTNPRRISCQTFFSEIDFVDGRSYPAANRKFPSS